jgi:hypothetical protein
MNLEEFLWRMKKTYREFSDEADISYQSLVHYCPRDHSPGLFVALKLYAAAGGKVSFIDMLSIDDLSKFEQALDLIKEKKITSKDGIDYTSDLALIASMQEEVAKSKIGRDGNIYVKTS